MFLAKRSESVMPIYTRLRAKTLAGGTGSKMTCGHVTFEVLKIIHFNRLQ